MSTPSHSVPHPILLWAHETTLSRTPLELMGSGGTRPGKGWVPVLAIPLTALAAGEHVETQEATFDKDGFCLVLRVLAVDRKTLRSLARKKRETSPRHRT